MEGFVITDGKMADRASIIRFLCNVKPFLGHIGFESDGKFIKLPGNGNFVWKFWEDALRERDF